MKFAHLIETIACVEGVELLNQVDLNTNDKILCESW